MKLSVVIPTYNRAPYLQECLKSICADEYKHLEIVVSDNASEDNTEEMVKSFADGRIRYYRQDTNMGAEHNLLKCLEYASGDYLLFLTDDDYMNCGAIEALLAAIDRYPSAGVILHALKRVDARTGLACGDYTPLPQDQFFAPGQESLLRLLWISQVLSSIILRKEALDMEGYRRHIGSMYPQIYLVGRAMKSYPTFYTTGKWITHRAFNVVFWQYKNDYMMGDKIRIVRDLLPGEEDRKCAQKLIDQAIRPTVTSALRQGLGCSIPSFFRQIRLFWAVPEVRRSRAFWWSILSALVPDQAIAAFGRAVRLGKPNSSAR